MSEVTSPVTGSVLEVCVAVGDQVDAGQQLLVLESMKMEFPIEAPHAGMISAIAIELGAAVQPGDPLVTIG